MALRAASAIPIALSLSLFGCEDFNSPPRAQIAGLVDGLLENPSDPVTIVFSEPVEPDSLAVKIAFLEVDIEGNLFDEDKDDSTTLDTIVDLSKKGGQNGGRGAFNADRTRYTIFPDTALPVGARMVLLIEPGLADDDGREVKNRQRHEFGFEFSCTPSVIPEWMEDGVYFFLADVELPIDTQIQLFAYLDIDHDTGAVFGQFTNADRIPDEGRCDPKCDASEACRTIPTTECVIPSEKAGNVDEFPDFLPNGDTSQAGYTFTVQACVADLGDGFVGFGNAPVDIDVPLPPVSVKGVDLSSSFSVAEDGIVRGSGSFTAEKVLLGIIDSGPGTGSLSARYVPEDEARPDIPKPPEDERPMDLGGGGGSAAP